MSKAPETIDPRAPYRVRHETRLRRLEVVGREDITPLMRRFTLRGDLAGFVSLGHADHIKGFFFPDGVEPFVAPITERGLEWPDFTRPQMRDYTPRAFNVASGTLVLDFVLHGEGPASGWAARARIGDHLVIGGPRGSLVVPAAYDWYLLAGDETALPAIARRIEDLGQGARILAVIEVADRNEEQRFETDAGLELYYVHRNGAEPGTTDLILERLRALEFPAGEAYAYIAGESTMSKSVRAWLTAERGFPDERVKAAGYWLRGVADAQEPH